MKFCLQEIPPLQTKNLNILMVHWFTGSDNPEIEFVRVWR